MLPGYLLLMKNLRNVDGAAKKAQGRSVLFLTTLRSGCEMPGNGHQNSRHGAAAGSAAEFKRASYGADPFLHADEPNPVAAHP